MTVDELNAQLEVFGEKLKQSFDEMLSKKINGML